MTTAICEIPGHADSGMKAMLMIGGGEGGNAVRRERHAHQGRRGEQHRDGEADHRLPAQLENGMNTKGAGNQPLAPTVLPDGTKQFALTTKIVDWEVEPGRTVKAWTYNGQVRAR